MNKLPFLANHPTRQPQSCASLSLPLLTLLDAVLPLPPHITLSVGSGPGLLEALLLSHYPSRAAISPTISFYGIEVEVNPGDSNSNPAPVNRFLPEQNALVVHGTWTVADEADEVEGLLFVYPRQRRLIEAYLRRGKHVRVVVWIGPRCDEEEMTGPLREWGEEVEVTGAGLVEEGEVVAVFRRNEREGE